MIDYKQELNKWLGADSIDEQTKTELVRMTEEEKKYAMSRYMEFGTAGLRAKMGAGCAFMNTYTVAHATAGVAKLICSEGESAKNRGVAIAYDSRNNSESFAKRSAEVLSAYGIKAYIFDSLRPTPELSFALRELNCIAGINITASHNPSEYNGYKAYWEDGAQISPEQAQVIRGETMSLDITRDVPSPDMADESLILPIPAEIDEKYISCVLGERVNPDAIPDVADSFKVVYTPLHGAGIKMIPEVLRRAGLTKLAIVPEQSEPDGNFPTVHFPNPEFPEAFKLGRKIAEDIGSELIVATDPDSDRVGVMVKNKDGDFINITGNQMGALLLDYIIAAYKSSGKMPDEPYAVKSVVSTALAAKICHDNGVQMYDVLTGFKYIGEVIKIHLAEGHGTFLLGFEESYGYLKGTYARDKDAVVASLLICEMAAYYKKRDMTLADALSELYTKYGYYCEKNLNHYFDTPDGSERMDAAMEKLRDEMPVSIAGYTVTEYRDYKTGKIIDTATGKESGTGLPPSNILYYVTERCTVVVRPSGTEPKLKVYFLANGTSAEDSEKSASAFENDIRRIMNL